MRGLNKNLINVFHSFKNTVFSYEVMVKKALNESGENKDNTLRSLELQMQRYIEQLAKMLDINNNIDIAVEKCNVIKVLEAAIECIQSNDNIKIKKIYNQPDVEVMIDPFYIIDAFKNILQNSVDAIMNAKQKGTITLEVDVEYEWAIIKISDDGIGIKKKDINSIFKPFYTTKSRVNNWGVGLSFVYKIINIHMGYISAQSKEGEETTFIILLPRA